MRFSDVLALLALIATVFFGYPGMQQAERNQPAVEAVLEPPEPDRRPPAVAQRQPDSGASQVAQFEALIRAYLDDVARNHAHSFRPTSTGDMITAMNEGYESSFRIQLQAGAVYRAVGACDNDCRDVDIIIVDRSGAVVGGDTLLDDYPVVDLRPGYTGDYTLKLIVAHCAVPPCYAGARLLRQ